MYLGAAGRVAPLKRRPVKKTDRRGFLSGPSVCGPVLIPGQRTFQSTPGPSSCHLLNVKNRTSDANGVFLFFSKTFHTEEGTYGNNDEAANQHAFLAPQPVCFLGRPVSGF